MDWGKKYSQFLEIILVLIIIIALFMPFAAEEIISPIMLFTTYENIFPFDLILERPFDFFKLGIINIPLSILLPLLIILTIKKSHINVNLLNFFKGFFQLLYVIIMGFYTYELILSIKLGVFYWNYKDPAIAILISTFLFFVNFMYENNLFNSLKNIMLSIIILPFVHYSNTIFRADGIILAYGGFIIDISIFFLYVMAIIKIYTGRNSLSQS